MGTVNTNGRLITEQLLDEICHVTKQINFGYNTPNPKTNMVMGKYLPNEKYGDYEQLISTNMDRVLDRGLQCELNILMTSLNAPDMADMAQVINEKGILRVRANEFTPSREAQTNEQLFETSWDEYISGCETLEKNCPGVEVSQKTASYYRNGFPIIGTNGILVITKDGEDIELADMKENINPQEIFEKVNDLGLN